MYRIEGITDHMIDSVITLSIDKEDKPVDYVNTWNSHYNEIDIINW